MPEANFNTIYPGGYGQQLRIQRNQAIANALMQESQKDTQVPYGSRMSPFQGMNRLAEALTGAYAGNQAIQEGQQYGQQAQEQMNNYMNGGQPFGMSGSPSPQALAGGLNPNMAQGGGQNNNPVTATGNPQADAAIKFGDMIHGTNEFGKGVVAWNSMTLEEKNAASSNPKVALKSTNIPMVNGLVPNPDGTMSSPAMAPTAQPAMPQGAPQGAAPSVPGQNLPGSSPTPPPVAAGAGGASGSVSSGPQSEGPFGGNAPVTPGMDRIPAPGPNPNLQTAQATAAPQMTSMPGTQAPQTAADFIAAQEAKTAQSKAEGEKTGGNIADVKKGIGGIDSRIQNAINILNDNIDLAPKTFSGDAGKKQMALEQSMANSGLYHPEGPKNQTLFEQNNANLFTQELPAIMAGMPGSRMDIPLINAIKSASQIPEYGTPEEKIAAGQNLKSLLYKYQQNVHNNAYLTGAGDVPIPAINDRNPGAPKAAANPQDIVNELRKRGHAIQ